MDEKEGEPTWRTELREAMDERFPFAQTMVTHDDVWRFVTPLIKAAEERGRRQMLCAVRTEIEVLKDDLPTLKARPTWKRGYEGALVCMEQFFSSVIPDSQ